MQSYIIRLSDPSVRDKLVEKFEKVGNPRSIHKTIIVETDKPKKEIENITGVVKVLGDEPIEFEEVQENPKNWALPLICGEVEKGISEGDYKYTRTGKNVDVYVMDTGVRITHDEFSDINIQTIHMKDEDEGDYGDNYHGTAVAAQVAGKKCGVAKEANIFNIWILETSVAATKGMDKVLDHHLNKSNSNPSILNMSFGRANSSLMTYEDETMDLVENGVICITSAGNSGVPKLSHPATHDHVLSVGSIDKYNKLSSFSNYGKDVDILAPGSRIWSATIDSDDSYDYASGTSFSCPLTSGVMALVVEGSTITNKDSVDKAIEILIDYSQKDKIELEDDWQYDETPNRLVYSLVDNDPIIEKYKLTTNIEGKGTVEPEELEVKVNDKAEFKIIPDDGHQFKDVKGIDGNISNNKFTTESIKQDTELTFIFEKKEDDESWFDKNKKYVVLGFILIVIIVMILTQIL